MKRADAEEVRNHRVDSGGLACAPRDVGVAVQTRAWRGRSRCQDCQNKSGLINNEGRDIKVGVFELSLWFGRQDQVIDNFRQPGVVLYKATSIPRWFKPHAPSPEAQSAVEPQMGGISTDDIIQVRGPV